jgi:putative membrane protein
MMGYGWGMGFGGWIAMTVFWVALIVLVVWVVSRLFPSGQHAGTGVSTGQAESAEEILRRRYAAGEIDTQTFQEMLAQLTATRSPGR